MGKCTKLSAFIFMCLLIAVANCQPNKKKRAPKRRIGAIVKDLEQNLTSLQEEVDQLSTPVHVHVHGQSKVVKGCKGQEDDYDLHEHDHDPYGDPYQDDEECDPDCYHDDHDDEEDHDLHDHGHGHHHSYQSHDHDHHSHDSHYHDHGHYHGDEGHEGHYHHGHHHHHHSSDEDKSRDSDEDSRESGSKESKDSEDSYEKHFAKCNCTKHEDEFKVKCLCPHGSYEYPYSASESHDHDHSKSKSKSKNKSKMSNDWDFDGVDPPEDRDLETDEESESRTQTKSKEKDRYNRYRYSFRYSKGGKSKSKGKSKGKSKEKRYYTKKGKGRYYIDIRNKREASDAMAMNDQLQQMPKDNHDYNMHGSHGDNGRSTHVHIHMHALLGGGGHHGHKRHGRKRCCKTKKRPDSGMKKKGSSWDYVPPNEYVYARCDMIGNSALPLADYQDITGSVFLRQKPGDVLQVRMKLEGFYVDYTLDEDVRYYRGFHGHSLGDTSNGCVNQGGHYNPLGVNHGGPSYKTFEKRHPGDFGNMKINDEGQMIASFNDSVASLFGQFSMLGRGIVIHAGKDDLGLADNDSSRRSGNAGARIACCGVVTCPKPDVFED